MQNPNVNTVVNTDTGPAPMSTSMIVEMDKGTVDPTNSKFRYIDLS